MLNLDPQTLAGLALIAFCAVVFVGSCRALRSALR